MSSAPRLVVIDPNGSRRDVPISAFPFRIGRQAGNELTLRDSRVSRQQAQITQVNGTMVLEDMGSSHGTFVNGEKILRHELKASDQIDFGVPDSYRVIYVGEGATIDELVERIEAPAPEQAGARELAPPERAARCCAVAQLRALAGGHSCVGSRCGDFDYAYRTRRAFAGESFGTIRDGCGAKCATRHFASGRYPSFAGRGEAQSQLRGAN